MHQPFLRVGDRHSVAETIWMGVHGQNLRFIPVLMPTECKYLSLLVMPRVCREATLRRARGVSVRVIFLGATALFGCVIRLCGGSVEGEDVDGPRLPDCCALFC
ncbi:hypothetical protein TcCL_NonESM11382 [Trypanosoma cruzi]|nr:hypothetical protein TcCL_NonESM11382 [Trypanosoma cruzi]